MMTTVKQPEPTQRFWQRIQLRSLIPYVLFGAGLVIAVAALGREFNDHIDAIEAWLTAIHPWGAVVYLGLFVVMSSLLAPSSVLAIIAGALFGLGWGMVAVVIGAFVASICQYALARWLFRGWFQRRLAERPQLEAVMQSLNSKPLRSQFMIRLVPLSDAIGSYALGAAGAPFGTYVLALFGLVPGLFLEIYFGHVGKHLARLASGDSTSVGSHDVALVAGLLVALVVMVIVTIKAKRALQSAERDSGETEPNAAPASLA